MGKLSAFSPIHSLLDIQYIVFEITTQLWDVIRGFFG